MAAAPTWSPIAMLFTVNSAPGSFERDDHAGHVDSWVQHLAEERKAALAVVTRVEDDESSTLDECFAAEDAYSVARQRWLDAMDALTIRMPL